MCEIMKETQEKLEITIVALFDTCNEDEDETDDRQTVVYNEMANKEKKVKKAKAKRDNEISLQLQQLGYAAESVDMLLELLPETSLGEERENETGCEEEEQVEDLCIKSNNMVSPTGRISMKSRKVKFTEDIPRVRQPRLCETHKTTISTPTFDKSALVSNKPLRANELEALEPLVSPKDEINGEYHQNHSRNSNTNDQSEFAVIQRQRIPVKMRSVNMFNSVLPSCMVKPAAALHCTKAPVEVNTCRSRIIPRWIKSKPTSTTRRIPNFHQSQAENDKHIRDNCRIIGIK